MSLPNTHYAPAEIAAALSGAKEIFFCGIGGIHMSALAEFCLCRGFRVHGSDRVESETTTRLRRHGARVFIGHDAAHITGADALIYTLALSPGNPEYAAAGRLGIPCISRADFLGYLMSDYPRRIGVAGSHGKSTVTALLAEIFHTAGRNPSVLCGAPMRPFDSSFLIGAGDDFIFEACEYRDSFLCFSPTIALLLNTDLDHVDYFKDKESICRSFAAFAALPGKDGALLYNADDEGARAAAAQTPAKTYAFSLSPGADFFPQEVTEQNGFFSFLPVTPAGALPRVTLCVPGRHNVYNALAAIGAATLSGLPGDIISKSVSLFHGAGRRMEYHGLFCGARLYDEYAHHPREIEAALDAARKMMGGNGRLFAVFQSHTYSRTAAFYREICAALRAADRVFVAPVYAARESDRRGMSPALLAEGIGARASAPGDLPAIARALSVELSPGDLLLVMGAGDVNRIFREFSEKPFTDG